MSKIVLEVKQRIISVPTQRYSEYFQITQDLNIAKQLQLESSEYLALNEVVLNLTQGERGLGDQLSLIENIRNQTIEHVRDLAEFYRIFHEELARNLINPSQDFHAPTRIIWN